ncbi:stress protein [Bacillus altitudinis]|uniref:stress protein n=1 Tax=Bacillus altitudinis TaxID=293387 RepID=UPI00080AAC1F|nr:stress protein [Bacillus altitudinis]ANT56717.1 stress protein [Bacillus pumilus]
MKKLSIFIFICLMMLTACSSAASNEKQLTTANIIEAFKSAGLEAEKPSDLKQKEFGNIREEGKRILIPSLGENAGGRIFDLQQAKSYYDELGNAGSMFFSHTHSKGNFLLQMNGEMKDSEFEKYKKVMDEEIK